jgi:hypothetical protein
LFCTDGLQDAAELVALDQFWREDYPKAVATRAPPHVTKAELTQVMTWKLKRGKMRPLLHLIAENTPEAVVAASTRACAHIMPAGAAVSAGDVEAALAALCVLRGVGPATASALLAPLCPAGAPFMADEAMDAVLGRGWSYTAADYRRFAAGCRGQAAQLGPPWTAEDVGRALWTAAKLPPQVLYVCMCMCMCVCMCVCACVCVHVCVCARARLY